MMAPEIQIVVRATQTWLQSSWHVQVPFAWLEACVEWLQEEAGGAGHLSQQQINQQVLDQWLLTDLRDLDYPVFPEGLAQTQKTELRGTFCVQVDSVLDISQPAYGQLQKCQGTVCANDEVSAITQTTQRPWEAKPTRMLLLQVTDGVQSLEAMEYQPIPALSSALRPGVKLQLHGQMVCRLGMLLLGPSNIKILGGEVEDLVNRNNQGRVLCRTLGLPEEQQQQQQQQQQQEDGEEAPPSHQGNQEFEALEPDDQDLLASLEAQEEGERAPDRPVRDSGYGTLSENSTGSLRSSSVRSLALSHRNGSVQSHHEQQESDLFDHHAIQQESTDHIMADEDFPDEDFDDLPMDELDSVIFQESTNVTTAQSDGGHRNTPQTDRTTGNTLDRTTKPQTGEFERRTLTGSVARLSSNNSGFTAQHRDSRSSTGGVSGHLAVATSKPVFPSAAPEPPHESGRSLTNDVSDFMDEDMDCFVEEVETYGAQTRESDVQQGPSGDRERATNQTETKGSSFQVTCKSSRNVKNDPQGDVTLTLTSPPFTYLCLLEELMSKSQLHTMEIRVKAFIVTLSGKLSSNNGLWRISATISDGSDYLDVELSDEVLTGLLGFSVAEKGALKRDPARRRELDAGMRRCQEELVDMCCIMTIVVEPEGRKAVVTKADPVNEKVLQELEQRVRDRRK
ncbi:hypothetical protein PAMA_018732 [Pampus argenteus]